MAAPQQWLASTGGSKGNCRLGKDRTPAVAYRAAHGPSRESCLRTCDLPGIGSQPDNRQENKRPFARNTFAIPGRPLPELACTAILAITKLWSGAARRRWRVAPLFPSTHSLRHFSGWRGEFLPTTELHAWVTDSLGNGRGVATGTHALDSDTMNGAGGGVDE